MEELLKDANINLEELLPFIIGAFLFQVLLWGLFANTVRKTLLYINEENRCMLPNQSWLLALPFFNIYWNFVVVKRLTDSLNNEFHDRKIAVEENPTQKEGYIYAGSYLTGNFPLPTFIKYIVSIVTLVGFIMYWVKVNQYRKILKYTSPNNESAEANQ